MNMVVRAVYQNPQNDTIHIMIQVKRMELVSTPSDPLFTTLVSFEIPQLSPKNDKHTGHRCFVVTQTLDI